MTTEQGLEGRAAHHGEDREQHLQVEEQHKLKLRQAADFVSRFKARAFLS